MILRNKIYILIMAVSLLCATAAAHAQVAQPAAWGKTPTMSEDIRPSYHFGSTSSYTPIVGNKSYLSDGSGPVSSQRRAKSWVSYPEDGEGWSIWGEDPDPNSDPMGQLGQTPIGEPLVLLVMALLYVVYIRIHKQRA